MTGFEQPETGRFRIAYSSPADYHLTLSADGYEDAEDFLPPLNTLADVNGLHIKLHRKGTGVPSAVPVQRITGTVTRAGRPVSGAWASLWWRSGEWDVVNVTICRGRTIPVRGVFHGQTPVAADGSYRLEVPFQGQWYVVIDEPSGTSAVMGPSTIQLNEKRTLDILCPDCGSITGRVRHVPANLRGQLWVVAFDDRVLLAQSRTNLDGTYGLDHLPPGPYGLKVGYDGYWDAEVPKHEPFKPWPKEVFEKKATPWQRAARVTVQPGQAAHIDLDPPG